MSTTNYKVNSVAYTEVSATDNILQNKSSVPIRVAYEAILPSLDTEDYQVIPAGQAYVRKDDFPAGNTYVRTHLADGDTSLYDVAVAEV